MKSTLVSVSIRVRCIHGLLRISIRIPSKKTPDYECMLAEINEPVEESTVNERSS